MILLQKDKGITGKFKPGRTTEAFSPNPAQSKTRPGCTGLFLAPFLPSSVPTVNIMGEPVIIFTMLPIKALNRKSPNTRPVLLHLVILGTVQPYLDLASRPDQPARFIFFKPM